MFTTNLSIIIITGTGAGHEPQNKSLRPEELSSTVLWLGLNQHTDWSAHRIGATRMVFLQPTTGAIQPAQGRGLSRLMEPMTSRKARHHQLLSISIPGAGFFLHRRTTEASSEKGMDIYYTSLLLLESKSSGIRTTPWGGEWLIVRVSPAFLMPHWPMDMAPLLGRSCTSDQATKHMFFRSYTALVSFCNDAHHSLS